ncbi:unnamed protein product [Cyberlindnera jadinii]|uniref:Uncharacterized protein n=1 Tax=Cyberlindnera jadinii (strain ATCC 18201 / CBS 1600 / BCRC 20928 / JCM 3617 / NBRC 0987 / NRRL Y-1542) TaxID=983966 RepID=A0A0H5C7N8_CYBJN|nr:unnamed protein product [Cyberlindnera jadinii]
MLILIILNLNIGSIIHGISIFAIIGGLYFARYFSIPACALCEKMYCISEFVQSTRVRLSTISLR